MLNELRALGMSNLLHARALLERSAQPIVVESGRLFAPGWDEAYVDIPAVTSPDACRSLCSASLWCVADDRPGAFAVKAEPCDLILVSQGLVQLIAFCAMQTAAGSAMSTGSGAAGLEVCERLFLEIVSNHCEHGFELPSQIAVRTFEAYRLCAIARDCMLLFVLLHELGHIVLGHLDGKSAGAIAFQSRIEDLDTDLHALEIASDDYAFRSIVNDDALNMCSALLQAWSYGEAGRRVIRGGSAHFSVTHPLSVNRLHRMALHLQARRSTGEAPSLGLDASIDWTAAVVQRPANSGLVAVEFDVESAISRHGNLLQRYAELVEPWL